MLDWQSFCDLLSQQTGSSFTYQSIQAVGGGCINQCFHLQCQEKSLFIKLNQAKYLAMFEAEAEGLRALAGSNSLRCPIPIASGLCQQQAFLTLDYLPMGHHGDSTLAGRQLAIMHRCTGDQYGFSTDNFIGTTPQLNRTSKTWPDFWRDSRLLPQLELATTNGFRGKLQKRGERLASGLEALIGHQPAASLLHGDLWGGNLSFTDDGSPVIFDPAVYYGDRAADLAMTELFGGFSPSFYAAYREAWPLDPEYATRKQLYNLYHILNHLNLFGGGYLGQAESMIERLLAEV